MKNSKITNWGILGCGKIAHKFAEDLQKVSNAKIAGVASRSFDKAKEFGIKFNSQNFYGSYEELVHNESIDVIYIATPHVFHKEHTLLCLRNKKAVLCEKPFGMNKEEVEEMITCAKANKVFLMEALWTYFLPHYQYVIDIIKTKKLGDVKSIEADFGFAANFDPHGRLFNKKLGGGSLLDIGIYPVFAALTVLGYPDHISAQASFSDTGIDESCSIEFLYDNGKSAKLYSTITEQTATKAIIQFDKGVVTLNSRFHEPTDILISTKDEDSLKTFDYTTNGYFYEAEHVQQMLNQNKLESNIMSFSTSISLIELLDKIRNIIGLNYN